MPFVVAGVVVDQLSNRSPPAAGSLAADVPESLRRKSGMRCRIGAEVFVAGVRTTNPARRDSRS
jgi:hypothetical protein